MANNLTETKEIIVLLHGFCESNKVWKEITPMLSKHHIVEAFNIPGFGGNPLETDNVSIESIAEILYQEIENLNNNKKVFLMGHSLGGYITLALAEKYPQSFKGIGLINSTSHADDEDKKEIRIKTIDFIKKHGKDKFLDSFVPGLFYEKEEKNILRIRAIADQCDAATMIAYTEAMRNRPSRERVLSNGNLPVLFIAGKHDQIVPEAKSLEQMELIDKGVTYLMDNSAHMTMIERPLETSDLIHEFVMKFCSNHS